MKLPLLPLSLSLFSVLLAHAEPLATPNGQQLELNLNLRGDFLPAEEALPTLQLPTSVAQGVVRLKTDYDECGATYVSDRGHLLTAGHCLVECFERSGAYDAHEGPGAFVTNDVNRAKVATGEVRCPMRLGPDEEPVTMRVLAARYCRVQSWDKDKPSIQEEKECYGRPDYALLEPLEDRPPGVCLRAEPKFPSVGTRIAAAGYPARTQWSQLRPRARDSDGTSQYFSLGKVVNVPYCRIEEASGEGGLEQIRKIYILNEKLLMMNFIQVDAGGVPGSSGGPLIDLEGRVRGVAHAISSAFKWRHYECKGSFFVTSLADIVRDLPRGVDLGQAFACNERVPR